MASKYLDDKGLSEVWKKIKDNFLPVKYVTQSEYNNLSSEEKNKSILYVIKK